MRHWSVSRTTAYAAALAALLVSSVGSSVRADTQVPSVLGDNMVLQRDGDVAVWGWDDAGQEVSVSFRGQSVAARADDNGLWIVRLPAGPAGGPFELSISGTSEHKLQNVLVGEVWIAGGQSNMWWAVARSENAEEEMAAATDANIRFYDANTHEREAGWIADEPQRTIDARWAVCSPETVGGWAAPAYFMARELRKALDVPVGIVHVAVPGSRIEPHMSKECVAAITPQTIELDEFRAKYYQQELAEYNAALADWEKARTAAEAEGETAPKKPRAPRDPATERSAGRFFNGMIYPIAPFTARGFIWWQGEGNAGAWETYRLLFQGLIRDWRRLWEEPRMPFIYVELANFLARQTRPVEDDFWPALRDAQTAVLHMKDVYRVCTIDILGEDENPFNIHPPRKQLAGHRLALVALANVYGSDIEWSGPVLEDAAFGDGRAVLTFEHVAGGLEARGGEPLVGFALAGADRVWHAAQARIAEGRVVLTSPEVPEPVAARYGWANNPVCNLYNKAGLPAPPFRTDDWQLGLRGWDYLKN